MTKQNGPRYSDSSKFDDKHDKIVIWLMDNYKAISGELLSRELPEGAEIQSGSLKIGIAVEEQLDPYNIPDVTVKGSYEEHHNGNLLAGSWEEGPNWYARLRCPVCGARDNGFLSFGQTQQRAIENLSGKIKEKYPDSPLTEEGVSSLTWKKEHSCVNRNFIFVFEVKSFIKSFGETMRQLQSYQKVLETRYDERLKKLVLVTPDLRFTSYFEQQGFKVIDASVALDERDNREGSPFEEEIKCKGCGSKSFKDGICEVCGLEVPQ